MMYKAWSSIEEVPYCFSRSYVKLQGHTAKKNHWFWPKLGVSGQQLQFEFTDGYEMLHKTWNSKGEVPYCFPRSSIKFQGHTGQNITDFYPNWAFPDYRPVTAFKSLRFALFPCGHIPSFWETYSKAHEIYAWFLLCCVLFCVVSTKFIHPHWKWFSPYPSRLLCGLWGNHMIAPVPVKQPWRIWLLAVRYDLNRGLPMCLLFIMYQGYMVICIFMNLM